MGFRKALYIYIYSYIFSFICIYIYIYTHIYIYMCVWVGEILEFIGCHAFPARREFFFSGLLFAAWLRFCRVTSAAYGFVGLVKRVGRFVVSGRTEDSRLVLGGLSGIDCHHQQLSNGSAISLVLKVRH